MLTPRCVRGISSRPRRGTSRVRVLISVFIFGATVPLTACSGSTSWPEPGPTASGGPAKLKVAVFTPGLTNDGSFNQVAREAVERLEGEGRIEADIREKMFDPAVAAQVAREYAAKGYDLIIGHGINLIEPMVEAAKAFPKVHFTVSGGPEALEMAAENVEAWTFDFGQEGYLAGFIAGKIKDVRSVGLVSGPRLSFIQTVHSGFKAGLKDSDPTRKWGEVYTGSFDDVQKAIEATTGLIGQGAQLIFTTGDGIATGVASAASRQQPKVLTIGVTGDAGGWAKQVNIASVGLDMYPIFKSYVDRVASGTFGNRGFTSTLANRGLVLTSLSEGVSDSRIPADLQAQVDKLVADLASGARTLPSFTS